jgi:hypothetical protein
VATGALFAGRPVAGVAQHFSIDPLLMNSAKKIVQVFNLAWQLIFFQAKKPGVAQAENAGARLKLAVGRPRP